MTSTRGDREPVGKEGKKEQQDDGKGTKVEMSTRVQASTTGPGGGSPKLSPTQQSSTEISAKQRSPPRSTRIATKGTTAGDLKDSVREGLSAVSRSHLHTEQSIVEPGQKGHLDLFAETLWAKCKGREGVASLIAEYREILTGDSKSLHAVPVKQRGIREKCRYMDIPCYEKTRVYLKDSTSDFIHANYVASGTNDRGFIMTQGPLSNTLGDFWKMVWQQDVCVIVMLCMVKENKREKCFPYWPLGKGQSKTVGSIRVVTDDLRVEKLDNDRILRSRLKVTNEDQVRFVDHYLHATWPDRGIPTSGYTIIKLSEKIHDANKQLKAKNRIQTKDTPPIVAGIGRSGTFVAINNCYLSLIRDRCADIFNQVIQLRKERAKSIQTPEQYIFVHLAILEFLRATRRLKFDATEYRGLIAKELSPH